MENKTMIRTVTGSIFDTSRSEGIAVFIPMGLVGIRLETETFVRRFTRYTSYDCDARNSITKELVVYSLPELSRPGCTRHLVVFDNLVREILTVEDMREQVNETLSIFAGLGAKTVAMNGIRSRTLPDRTTRPEQYQRQFVEEYLENHPFAFETIWLVDKRGGFDK